MSRLIIETEMNGIPDCCGLCDPLLAAVCAMKHDQTIDKMMLRVGRPSWCPIKGVLPDEHGTLVDYDEVEKEFNRLLTYMEEVPDENGVVWFRRETIIPRGYRMEFHSIVPAERKDYGKTTD